VTTILHTHLKGQRNTYREHATWQWFERYDKQIEKQGWDIAHVEIDSSPGHDYDYDGALRHFWGKDDLLLFERDMVPHSWGQLVDLVSCPEVSCSIDYPLVRCWCIELESRSGRSLLRFGKDSAVTVCVKHKAQESMMRDNVPEPEKSKDSAKWSDGTWDHCDMAPLGLTRFRKELQLKIPAGWPPTTWLELDGIVTGSLYLNGVRTHVHGHPQDGTWARHYRKKTGEKTHDLVAIPPITHHVVYANDLLPEYYLVAMKRLKDGFVHADRPQVWVA